MINFWPFFNSWEHNWLKQLNTCNYFKQTLLYYIQYLHVQCKCVAYHKNYKASNLSLKMPMSKTYYFSSYDCASLHYPFDEVNIMSTQIPFEKFQKAFDNTRVIEVIRFHCKAVLILRQYTCPWWITCSKMQSKYLGNPTIYKKENQKFFLFYDRRIKAATSLCTLVLI